MFCVIVCNRISYDVICYSIYTCRQVLLDLNVLYFECCVIDYTYYLVINGQSFINVQNDFIDSHPSISYKHGLEINRNIIMKNIVFNKLLKDLYTLPAKLVKLENILDWKVNIVISEHIPIDISFYFQKEN